MTDTFDRPARVLVAYYSATGHVDALAKALAQGAEVERRRGSGCDRVEDFMPRRC